MTLGVVYHMPFWRASDGTLREVEGSFARYVDSIAPYFDRVSLCVPVSREPIGEGTPIRSRNVTVAALPLFDGPAQFYPRLIGMAPALTHFIREIDLLHCRVPTPAAVFAYATARLLRRPVFLLVVGDLRALLPAMPYTGLKRMLWRAYTEFEERGIQWMADHALTFANGAALARKHARGDRAAIETTTTTTIHDADIAGRVDTRAGAERADIRALTVSRIDPRKGLRVLPSVVGLLAEAGIALSLDIVGPVAGRPGEEERAVILEQAARDGVSDRISFRGAVPLDRLLPMYRQYDVFLLPTRPGEGIPRVLLEAMSAGVPVVTTSVAGIPELVTHETNGLLVEQPTAAALADAVERIVRDESLRRRLIAQGLETARRFTLETQAARMMDAVSRRLQLVLRRPEVAPESVVPAHRP